VQFVAGPIGLHRSQRGGKPLQRRDYYLLVPLARRELSLIQDPSSLQEGTCRRSATAKGRRPLAVGPAASHQIAENDTRAFNRKRGAAPGAPGSAAGLAASRQIIDNDTSAFKKGG
jgi:hypothetical protein